MLGVICYWMNYGGVCFLVFGVLVGALVLFCLFFGFSVCFAYLLGILVLCMLIYVGIICLIISYLGWV